MVPFAKALRCCYARVGYCPSGPEADTCLARLCDYERAPGLSPGCLPEQAGRRELADQTKRRLRRDLQPLREGASGEHGQAERQIGRAGRCERAVCVSPPIRSSAACSRLSSCPARCAASGGHAIERSSDLRLGG